MGNQHSSLELDSLEEMFWVFQEIEKIKKFNKFSIRECWLDNRADFKSQWCRFTLWTVSQKSAKINKFLGTSPKSIKHTEKAIKQTMAN